MVGKASAPRRASTGSPLSPSRPRLLLVGNFFHRHGRDGQYCRYLADQLVGRGYPVLTVSRWRPRLLRLVEMTWVPWWQRRNFDVAQVDVFSGPSFVWAEAATTMLRAAGKPFVLTLHGGALPEFARRHPRRVALVLHRAAAVTAPSSYLASTMKALRPDIQVIPNALDLSRYLFRHRQGVKPNLIWLRAFHRMYEPEMAIDVLARLAGKHPEVHLTMVGPDKDGSLGRCRAAAVERGVEGRVGFVAGVPKEQVPHLLASADIFLNTTTVDNTPVSVIEAMACGLCVVSTDAGGMPHLVRAGQEALLLPVGDAAAMAGAVERLLREPALAAQLSSHARAKAEGFDWSAVLPQWEELLQRSAAQQKKTPQGARRRRFLQGAFL